MLHFIRLRTRRPTLLLAALAAGLLTGCNCCWHKKGGGPEWGLFAGANGRPGFSGAGSGSTGGGSSGGGGGGGGGPIPEIHPGAAAGVLTLVVGSMFVLRDRRRPGPVTECT